VDPATAIGQWSCGTGTPGGRASDFLSRIRHASGPLHQKYPDGHREWVSFARKIGDEVLVRRLDDGESSSLADGLAQPNEKADFDFDPPQAELKRFQSEALFTDESDEALLDERLAEIRTSTQAANNALDDALSSIAASNRRIDKMLGNKPGED
jgi:hypothetical protein